MDDLVPDNTPQNESKRRRRSDSKKRQGETIRFPENGWARTPPAFDFFDRLTQILICISVIFAPWALGTTVDWAINTMNIFGFLIGALFIGKWIVRYKFKYVPHRWGFSDIEPSWRTRVSKILMTLLAILTIFILLFCATSAINARVHYYPSQGLWDYIDNYIDWLPHSYNQTASWASFFSTLALACFFWGTRDWVLGKTRKERHAKRGKDDDVRAGISNRNKDPLYIPDRLKILLWFLAGNAALLSLVSIIQRFDGGNKLLWLVEPPFNKTNQSQFGPYAYRSNAAQYLNLAWPVCLGFWWAASSAFKENFKRTARLGQGAHVVLLPLGIIIAISPLIATSRGGVLISLIGTFASVLLFLFFSKRTSFMVKSGILILFAGIVGFGGWLGWDTLEKRLFRPNTMFSTSAKETYSNEVTVKTSINIPESEKKKNYYLQLLSPIETPPNTANTLEAWIGSNGHLNIRLKGKTASDWRMSTVTNFVANYQGKDTELQWVKKDGLEIYVNGDLIQPLERTNGMAPLWGSKTGIKFLRNGVGFSGSGQGGYIQSTEVYNKALTPTDIELAETLSEKPEQSGLIFKGDFTGDSFFDTINQSSSGRNEIFNVAWKIYEDFPLFGTGPGSFFTVNKMYLENSYQTWHGYVHDDFLETLTTYGIVGSSVVALMILIVFVHWLIGSGIHQSFPFYALMMISLLGCLGHAKFDFPFQVYSITHLFVMICCVLVCTARRA